MHLNEMRSVLRPTDLIQELPAPFQSQAAALPQKSGVTLGPESVPPAVAGGSMMSIRYRYGF